MFKSVRSSLALLDLRSRRILVLLTLVQVFLAFLDLLGIILFGLVAALSASVITSSQAPVLGDFLARLNLDSVDPVQLAVGLAAIAGLLFILKSVMSFLLIRRSYKFLANRQAMVSSSLAERLLSRPLLEVQRQPSQETAMALTIGVNAATNGVLGSAVIMSAEIAVLLVVAGGLLVIDPLVAISTVVFFSLVAYILNRAMGNWARRLGTRSTETEIASLSAVQNAIRTYREVSVAGRRGLVVHEFMGLRWKAAQVQSDLQIMNQVSKYVFEVALVIGGGILAISQWLTQEVVAAVAIIAVFLAAASRITPSLLRLQQAALGIRSSAGIATPTFALAQSLDLNAKGDSVSDPELLSRFADGVLANYPGFTSSVILQEVSMRYPSAKDDAVCEVTFAVEPGGAMALVGPTGAGKSTIADLILGVLRPDSGNVTLSDLTPSEACSRWPGAIAYVPQEATIIEGTVRENVALGIPAAAVRDDLVWEALERSHLSSFLAGQREGINTFVGEQGVRLSGGQRQRLGLARALYSRPRLLVMDEATSALDAETERFVSDALQELEGQVTLIVVAHRLATIQHFSQIAYIEQGVVKAIGSFQAVRNLQPNFDKQAQLLGL